MAPEEDERLRRLIYGGEPSMGLTMAELYGTRQRNSGNPCGEIGTAIHASLVDNGPMENHPLQDYCATLIPSNCFLVNVDHVVLGEFVKAAWTSYDPRVAGLYFRATTHGVPTAVVNELGEELLEVPAKYKPNFADAAVEGRSALVAGDTFVLAIELDPNDEVVPLRGLTRSHAPTPDGLVRLA